MSSPPDEVRPKLVDLKQASFVKETKRELNLRKVPARLELYDSLIDVAEPLFELKGKTLETAIKQHAQDLMYYDNLLQECKTIEDVLKIKLEKVEGDLYRKYATHGDGQRALGTRDITYYIKSDEQYMDVWEVILEVTHMKRKLESVVEALKTMGWNLSHITKLKVAQMDHVVL